MKKSFFTILPALLLFMIFSCDSVEKLTEIDFPVTLSQTLPVVVTNTNEMTTTVVLDATTNSEIAKYLDNIKGYEITELLFAIENYQAPNEDEAYFNGTIGFSKKAENQPTSSCPAENIPITHWAGTGDFEVVKCTSVVNEISAILTADNAVKIYVSGIYTKAPLSFDLKITTTVKVTATPL